MRTLTDSHPDTTPLIPEPEKRKTSKRANGEGTLFKRTTGSKIEWVGRFMLENGKHFQATGKTQGAVKERLAKARLAIAQGLPATPSTQTLGAYLVEWLEQSARPKLKASTYRSYAEIVNLHLVPELGHHKVAKLEPSHVQKLLNSKRASGLSARRVEYIRAVLRAALNRAMKWQLVHRNVATLIDLPGGPRRQIEPLEPEAASALLAAARGHRHEHLYAFLLATGLRLGEALGLRWADVDMEQGKLRVHNALERLPGQPWRLIEPKSEAGRRVIPLIAPVRATLRAQKARIAAMELKLEPGIWQDLDFVFPTEIGTPNSGGDVNAELKPLLAAAGLPTSHRVHDLRHSTATYLTSAGVPPRVIMELLGHSSLAMTVKYQHVMSPMLLDAAARLEAMFPVASARR